jgi:histidinol-phosphate/aromatic aminotransferase/cobyric acid decarboxylase-like protein
LRDRLLGNYGLMVRECSNKAGAGEQYLRLAVQPAAAVDVLVTALRSELRSRSLTAAHTVLQSSASRRV